MSGISTGKKQCGSSLELPSSHGKWVSGKRRGGGMRSHTKNGNSDWGGLMVLGSPTSTGKAGGAREMHWRILPRCETVTVKNSPEVCVAKHNLHEHSLGIPGTPHHPPHTNCSSSPTLRIAGGSETLQRSLLCSLQPRNLPDFGERRKVWQEGQSSTTSSYSGESQHLLLGLSHRLPRWDPKNRRSDTNLCTPTQTSSIAPSLV